MDRLGAQPPADAPPVEEPSQGFSFSTPTEFVDLPSRGKYYPEGHSLRDKEQAEIRFMTAKDEDILSSRTLLKNGLAIERLVKNILVDRTIDTDTLLVGDKNAILVASRITGYGDSYEARTMCPSCTTTTNQEYDLSSLSVYYGGEWGEFDVRQQDESFVVTVPQSKVEVEVRLLTSKDEQHLSKLTESKRKKKLPENNLTDQLKHIIVSVNGHSDGKSITTFVDGMPARDSSYLRKAYEKIVPNIDLSVPFNCSSCGFEQEVSMPFTAACFWPNR